MNKEQIIKLAREAGFGPAVEWSEVYPPFERFAQAAYAAGAVDEREACAKVCEEHWEIDGTHTAKEFASVIRARGEK